MFPLIHYPNIYGVDAFKYMWMAQALQNGALISENTWFIHPTSYLGYYPFSQTPIGVPLFLAILIEILNIISFGTFGITEAILALDIILILVTFKSAKSLGDTFFEEKWCKFIFVSAMVLSPDLIQETTMIVSTRLLITIVMMLLLNLNLKIILKKQKSIKKIIFYMILLFLIGALSHRLWLNTLLTVVFMIITKI
jgi:hypothetical protein